MKITSITVTYQETASIPGYSNVRPAVTYTADIEPRDEPDKIQKMLMDGARAAVRAEIDDALESYGVSPKYCAVRFRVYENYAAKIITVLPESAVDSFDNFDFQHVGPEWMSHRRAMMLARKSEYTLIDCSNGKLERLFEILGR